MDLGCSNLCAKLHNRWGQPTYPLFLHIAWKYKPSQPIGDHPLWPCPLRVVSNFVRHSYIHKLHCIILINIVFINARVSERWTYLQDVEDDQGSSHFGGFCWTFPSRICGKFMVRSRWSDVNCPYLLGLRKKWCHWKSGITTSGLGVSLHCPRPFPGGIDSIHSAHVYDSSILPYDNSVLYNALPYFTYPITTDN